MRSSPTSRSWPPSTLWTTSSSSDGDPYIDLKALTRGQAAGLIHFEVEDFKDGWGKDARDVRRIRIKLCDTLDALSALCKRHGADLLTDDWTEKNLNPS